MQFMWVMPDPAGNATFDRHRIREAVRALPWVRAWREPADESDFPAFECELDAGGRLHPVPVRMHKDFTCLVIGSYCDRGLEAALAIRDSYGSDLYAFSEECLPETVPLGGIRTVAELEQRLKIR
jgi:hypothetical protein